MCFRRRYRAKVQSEQDITCGGRGATLLGSWKSRSGNDAGAFQRRQGDGVGSRVALSGGEAGMDRTNVNPSVLVQEHGRRAGV